MANNSSQTVIIGGGLAGLAAAVELAATGQRVTLIEKNAHLGGKMNVLSDRGYSFDMGPTIITMPQVLRGIIDRAKAPGTRVEDYIDLRPCDPQWRCMYEDGTRIDLCGNVRQMAERLGKQFGPEVGAGYEKFLTFSRRMYKLSERVFFYRDVGSALDLMKQSPMNDFGLLKDVLAMRAHSTMAATAHKNIAEPHVRQMVEHAMQYVGSNPFWAPAILSLIASAQADHGVWYPMGGTRMVSRALERLAVEREVTLIRSAKVARINSAEGVVTGVTLDDGREIGAAHVVSNCDVQRTNRDLIAGGPGRREQQAIAARYTPACSGVVLYLGLDRQYEHLAHHNFLFSSSSDREFGDIYTRGVPTSDPTLYLAAPSRTDPTQAPAGGEALYVLVHTPFIRAGQQWGGEEKAEKLMAEYKPVIMAKLKRFGMPDIEQHVVVDRFLHPGMIDQWYNAEGGAIYGLASHGKLRGGFKPKNRSNVLKGLYLCGGSANPGPGVPMVLMSGVTAARAVMQDAGVPMASMAQIIEAKPDAVLATR